jgi:mutator protein MutT
MQIAVIIIRNSKGEYFVHQRRAEKKVFPNLFGLGAGGKIEEGEDVLTGALRELEDETGITGDITYLFEFDFESEEVSYPIFVYELTTDQTITPTQREWKWSGWMTKDQVDQLLINNELCPDTAVFYKRYLLG